jgi:hypothetical protein
MASCSVLLNPGLGEVVFTFQRGSSVGASNHQEIQNEYF